MSMIGNYRRITSHDLESLQAAPQSISDYLYTSSGAVDLQKQHLDIDKAWHAIHFLLTGNDWEGVAPLGNVVLGGTPLGEQDVGYGPARFLTSQQVQEVAEALMKLPEVELKSRYDPVALTHADIYPQIWDEGDDALEYITSYYTQLVQFFQSAANDGDAVLLYIN